MKVGFRMQSLLFPKLDGLTVRNISSVCYLFVLHKFSLTEMVKISFISEGI